MFWSGRSCVEVGALLVSVPVVEKVLGSRVKPGVGR
jgi:hypothetical protein